MSNRTPKGYWKLEAYTNGYEIIFIGDPPKVDEDSPLYHNCDAMGCGNLAHVVARLPVLEPTPELKWIQGYSLPHPTMEITHENN